MVITIYRFKFSCKIFYIIEEKSLKNDFNKFVNKENQYEIDENRK